MQHRLTIDFSSTDRTTVRLVETHAFAAGDVYNPLVLHNVEGADPATLLVMLKRAVVPGGSEDDSVREVTVSQFSQAVQTWTRLTRLDVQGSMSLSTQEMADWYLAEAERLASAAGAEPGSAAAGLVSRAAGAALPSFVAEGILEVRDSQRLWCRAPVPVILRQMSSSVASGADGRDASISVSREDENRRVKVVAVSGGGQRTEAYVYDGEVPAVDASLDSSSSNPVENRAVKAALDAMESDADALALRVSSLETGQSSLGSGADALALRVSALESGKADASDADALALRVSALESGKADASDADAVAARVAALEGTAAQLRSGLDDLAGGKAPNSSVTALASRVSALESDADALETSLGVLSRAMPLKASDLANDAGYLTPASAAPLLAAKQDALTADQLAALGSVGSDTDELFAAVAALEAGKADRSELFSSDGDAPVLKESVLPILDCTGVSPVIKSSYLPSYVDDVVEFPDSGAFPPEGSAGVIYVAKDTNLTYRWSGSGYVEISPSLALGATSSTAFPGDRGLALEGGVSALESDADALAGRVSALESATPTVDSALSGTSENPVQNKAVKAALDEKLSRAEAKAGFTEWVVERDGVDVTSQIAMPPHYEGVDTWIVEDSLVAGDELPVSPGLFALPDAVELSWESGDGVHVYTAARAKLCPTNTSELTNDSGFLTEHQQLTPVYSFGEWTCEPAEVDGMEVLIADDGGSWYPTNADGYGGERIGDAQSTRLTWDESSWWGRVNLTAVRTKNIVGYTLGSQTAKPLQPQGDYAVKSEMSVTPGTGDVTIQLKSGMSVTVLTNHQSWSDVKPSGGVPMADLAGAVQTSLTGRMPMYPFETLFVPPGSDYSWTIDSATASVDDFDGADKWMVQADGAGGYLAVSLIYPEVQVPLEYSDSTDKWTAYYENANCSITATVTESPPAVSVSPYTVGMATLTTVPVSVAVGALPQGVSNVARDCVLVLDCSSLSTAPTVTWPNIFHPRSGPDDLACDAGAVNVYYISEYMPGRFVVGRWAATDGSEGSE